MRARRRITGLVHVASIIGHYSATSTWLGIGDGASGARAPFSAPVMFSLSSRRFSRWFSRAVCASARAFRLAAKPARRPPRYPSRAVAAAFTCSMCFSCSRRISSALPVAQSIFCAERRASLRWTTREEGGLLRIARTRTGCSLFGMAGSGVMWGYGRVKRRAWAGLQISPLDHGRLSRALVAPRMPPALGRVMKVQRVIAVDRLDAVR